MWLKTFLPLPMEEFQQFKEAMHDVMDQYGTAVEIIQAHSCETDPTKKRLLEVAGLYCSYLQLRGRVPDEDRAHLGKQAAVLWAEIIKDE